MRKLFLILFLTLSINLVAKEKPVVLATASIFADMAKNIAGGELEVQLIVPIGGDPHLYEPTPGDAQKVAEADLILKNGLTFEGWLNELIENSGTKAKVVTITDGIQAITSEKYKNSTDPHAWMDAQHGQTYIENVKNALVALAPDNADIFEFNYNLYRQQLEDLDFFIKAEIAKIPEAQRILITSHDAFQYYGRRYGIQLESILGTSTDAEEQTSDIIRLNKVIQESQVPAIFVESTINPKLLKQIAKDNDIAIGGELYADSLGDEKSPASTYIDMLKHNTTVIVKALSQLKSVDNAATENEEEKGTSNFVLYAVLGILLIGGFFWLIRKLNN
jgi:ABC-type Zn uptake system ZnuABC Zn-binding protein ZnuA